MSAAGTVGGSFRLASGGLIDRSRILNFSFDGKRYRGQPGDTLASALLANGVRLVGRSFKYHRPRGICTAGVEEPNALVQLWSGARTEPNTPATTIELFEGLEAWSQNRWPSLRFDLLSINSRFGAFLGAGFYYKTFMWPRAFWEKLYEPLIRRSAGLGRASREPDPDHYEKATAHCDVLVVGGGPAGLMAARIAGDAGARVILVEQDFEFGGRLLSEQLCVSSRPGPSWVAEWVAELAGMDNVRLMPRTTVYGVYDGGTYGAVERVGDGADASTGHRARLRGWRIIAGRSVLASGAVERPVVFAGNDLPGVMLASAARTYLNRFGVAPGRRAVVFTTSDDGWTTARDLAAAGVTVEAVVDPRGRAPDGFDNAWRTYGGVVKQASGGRHLKSVTVRDKSGATTTIACDLLAVSNGWNPTLHLTCHLSGKPQWDESRSAFVPGTMPDGMQVAGAASGALILNECLASGARGGLEAARASGFDAQVSEIPGSRDAEASGVEPVWRVEGGKGKTFIDLQNDVTDQDIAIAHREGYSAVEHLKRYATLGMGTDQGKTSNVAGLAIMAEIAGRSIPETGTTSFRPPYTPVSVGALAGHHRGRDFRPTRLPPSHGWAEANVAVFAEAGLWLRAQWFPRDGEDWQQAVTREVDATRGSVGICDVSTLGKIDVQGADAGTFLDRVYINKFSSLAVGRARYGVMLREDGFVMDDGTVARFGPEHFVASTTTAQAAKVMQHLEFCRQVLWPTLDIQLASVTDQWAQYSLAGPNARAVLRKIIDPQHDVSDAAFPRMAAGEVTISGGVTARLFRVSFSGERAYEIAVPLRYGDALFRALMEAGAEFGITPYGTEALNVMRIEKGHAGGPEINGQTTARDLGLGGMVAAKDCIGRVMAGRPALTDPARPILVGFRPIDPSQRLTAGAHFIPRGKPAVTENDQGHMTSVAWSPSLRSDIGLGFLASGRERIGERIRAVDLLRGLDVECEIVSPVFVDPEGERQRG